MGIARALLTVAVVVVALGIATVAVGLGMPPAGGILLVAIVALPVVGQIVLAGLTRPAEAPAFDTTAARVRLLRVKAETYLEEGIAEAERLARLEARDPLVADELSRLYARAGRMEEARWAAAAAVERALAAAQPAVAAAIVRRFDGDPRLPGLRPASLEKLAWALLQGGDLDAAARAFDALAQAAGGTTADPERVQKGLVAVADAAAAAGHAGRALAMYRAFLERHPSASLASYVRSAVARLERAPRALE